MQYVLLGWPADGPTLRLDHEEFAYAGKFVMSTTGKAIARKVGSESEAEPVSESVVAATAFNADRTDEATLWIRYVTVRADRRGEGLGPRLLRFTVDKARERGYDHVQIAVNNPFAYEAAYRAGFAFTGKTTGIAELVLAVAGERDPDSYVAGLDRYRQRDLSSAEESFLEERPGATQGAADPVTVPAVVDPPPAASDGF